MQQTPTPDRRQKLFNREENTSLELYSCFHGQSNFMKQIDMKHDEATNTAEEKLFTMGELEQEEPTVPMRQLSWDKLIREERGYGYGYGYGWERWAREPGEGAVRQAEG